MSDVSRSSQESTVQFLREIDDALQVNLMLQADSAAGTHTFPPAAELTAEAAAALSSLVSGPCLRLTLARGLAHETERCAPGSPASSYATAVLQARITEIELAWRPLEFDLRAWNTFEILQTWGALAARAAAGLATPEELDRQKESEQSLARLHRSDLSPPTLARLRNPGPPLTVEEMLVLVPAMARHPRQFLRQGSPVDVERDVTHLPGTRTHLLAAAVRLGDTRIFDSRGRGEALGGRGAGAPYWALNRLTAVAHWSRLDPVAREVVGEIERELAGVGITPTGRPITPDGRLELALLRNAPAAGQAAGRHLSRVGVRAVASTLVTSVDTQLRAVRLPSLGAPTLGGPHLS